MARKRKKNRAALPLGIITVILAVVGLVTVVRLTSDFVKDKRENTAAKQKYEELLKPVVMFDPDPFDDLTKADKAQLLNSAIWALLMDEEGMSKYPYATGENFGIQIPRADVEASFTKLYGNEIDVAQLHSSTDMSKYDIVYDTALQSYVIPITGVESAYTPRVYSIDKQGSSLILNVGYIGNKVWADIGEDGYTAPEPDKYMKITLRERNGEMYVASIQAADGQEIAEKVTAAPTYEYEEEEYAEDETADVTESTADATQESAEAVAVTDENGEPVTDENGETVTAAAGESETLENGEPEESGEEE